MPQIADKLEGIDLVVDPYVRKNLLEEVSGFH
jgi:hypothetical protein